MTYQEYTQLLSQLPEHIRKEYGFNEPFDYSPYKCIHTDEYDYYPELNCCIIDNVPIIWESGNPWVTPENPEHLATFKDWAKRYTQNTIALIGISKNDKHLSCTVCTQNKMINKHIKKRGFIPIPFDEGNIYYIPSEIDLPNKPQELLLTKCLFTAQKYEPICLIPEQNISAFEWLNGR